MTNNKNLLTALNQALANTLDLKLQSKQAHWNVKDKCFLMLHELFDKIAEETEKLADLLAERIKQLGGTAYGTIADIAKNSLLPIYPIDITEGATHVSRLKEAMEIVCDNLKSLIHIAEENDDPVTADIGTEIKRTLDQFHWFLAAHL